MSGEILSEEAYRKLVARCSARELCESEVRDKLRNWSVSRVDEDRIVEQLYNERYIDENRYAQAFANDKFRFDGWGRIKIGYTLRQKAIDALTVSQALQAIDEIEYRDALLRILKSKMRSLKAMPQGMQREKLMRFAMSRGFEPNLICESLKELSLECEIGSEI